MSATSPAFATYAGSRAGGGIPDVLARPSTNAYKYVPGESLVDKGREAKRSLRLLRREIMEEDNPSSKKSKDEGQQAEGDASSSYK